MHLPRRYSIQGWRNYYRYSNPKLNFVNSTESEICGIPKTPTNQTNSTPSATPTPFRSLTPSATIP
jgi:hypothetical protein